MSKLQSNAALIIIDVQKAFDHPLMGNRNNLQAESNIAKLLKAWRETKRPVFFIRHVNKSNSTSVFKEGTVWTEFKEMVQPIENEKIITKNVNSAFIGTNLEEELRKSGIDTVVITGLTTNHCVETTTRMAGNLGFNTYLVSDAAATFDRKGLDGKIYPAEEIHNMTLVNLNEEFASIIDTETLLQKV